MAKERKRKIERIIACQVDEVGRDRWNVRLLTDGPKNTRLFYTWLEADDEEQALQAAVTTLRLEDPKTEFLLTEFPLDPWNDTEWFKKKGNG